MQLVLFTVDRKFSQTKTFSQKVFFMFCLEFFYLKCIIKDVELKVNAPLKLDLTVPYVTLWIIRYAWVAHWYTCAPCRCRTSNTAGFFSNDLDAPVFNVVELAGFKSRANAFALDYNCSLTFCLLLFSLSLLSLYELVQWGWGLRTDRV